MAKPKQETNESSNDTTTQPTHAETTTEREKKESNGQDATVPYSQWITPEKR